MLEALDKSVEDPSLISIAKKYLNGILTSAAQIERRKTFSAQVASEVPVSSPSVDAMGNPTIIDLTL
jgi:hypothetical protein